MKKFVRSYRVEIVLVIAFTALITVLNSLHVIREWFLNPADRLFAGIAHFYADYFLYAAQMAQGLGGNLLYRHVFTNEYLPPTWIYWFNLLLGNIGNPLGLSPFTIYNASLAILVFSLIILWYILAKLLFPTDRWARIVCFGLIVTVSSMLDVGQLIRNGNLTLVGQFWFSPTPAFNRLGGVPHQVFQTILFIVLTIAFAENLTKPRPARLLTVLVITILAGTANPVQMFVFTAAATLVTLWFLFTVRKDNRMTISFSLICFLLVSFISAWLTDREFNRQAVFAVAKAWEAAQQFPPVTVASFLLSVGPIAIFAPFGIRSSIRRAEPLPMLLVAFGVLSLLFFVSPIPKLLTTHPVRYLHPASYALWSILATEGILVISRRLSAIKVFTMRLPFRTYRNLMLILYITLTVPSLFIQVRNRVNPLANPLLLLSSDYNHVPVETASALSWLKSQPDTPEQAVVLTDPNVPVEVLVPAFSNKISFTGHPIHTLYPADKESLRNRFFTGILTLQEARQFFTNHRIGYIIGLNSRNNRTLFSRYPFMQQVYDNARLAIWKVAAI
jgi:hypothetical protein